MDGLAIGIDLGTYNSCAAYAVDARHVHIIKSLQGPTPQGLVFPSFLRFDVLGNVTAYGEDARLQMSHAPESVVWGVKRLIGRSFHQVEKELNRFAYPIEEGPDGRVVIPIGPHRFTPAEISTLVLKWIKYSAETFNPLIVEQIRGAVITHPAYFDTSQIDQTKEAASCAGFDKVELIAEPVAAALAYGIQLDSSNPQFIMTIDWGAGTLDIVVVALKLNKEGRPILSEARPARGDVALGGIDMDDSLVAHAVEVFDLKEFQPLVERAVQSASLLEADILDLLKQSFSSDMRELGQSIKKLTRTEHVRPEVDNSLWGEYYNLRNCIEQAKINLSKIPAIRAYTTYQGKSVEIKMARTAKDRLDTEDNWIILESVLEPSLNLFRRQVEFAIEKCGLNIEMIQHVLLVGGPMHMPCVRRIVHEIFTKNRSVMDELSKIEQHGFPVNPMEAVARGAALNAGGTGPTLGTKRIARDYGVILGAQGEILIHDGDGVPCEASLSGPLGGMGKPGQAVPIGLYTREEGLDGEKFWRMGDYEYVVTVGPDGMFSFLPALRAEQDKTVSLVVSNLLTNESMHLERLDVVDGRSIAKPLPVGREGPPTSPPNPQPINGRKKNPLFPDAGAIEPERVSQQKRAATAAVQFARYALQQHPLLQTDAAIRRKVEEKASSVEQAIKLLPANGPVDQGVFASLANRTTELIHFLKVHRMLSDKETQL
jgi:molecular chaperone DnaK (HSP70)